MQLTEVSRRTYCTCKLALLTDPWRQLEATVRKLFAKLKHTIGRSFYVYVSGSVGEKARGGEGQAGGQTLLPKVDVLVFCTTLRPHSRHRE